jgi:hypothetical protein
MSKMQTAPAVGFTAGERDYIRREPDMFFSTFPTVAEGFSLRTWRGGPQAGKPKLPPAAKTLPEREPGESLGRCPCCASAEVLDTAGQRAPFAEYDHFYASSHPDPEDTWSICRTCHSDLTTGRVPRDQREAEFRAYQSKRRRLAGQDARLF